MLYSIFSKNIKSFALKSLSGTYSTSRKLSFLSGSNASYIDDLYKEWKKDSQSVHKSWDLLFRASDKGIDVTQYYRSPPLSSFGSSLSASTILNEGHKTSSPDIEVSITENLAVCNLIRSYQHYGHTISNLDPLGIIPSGLGSITPKALTLEYWGLKESQLDKNFRLPSTTYIGGNRKEMTLREIISSLTKVYGSKIAIEYSHLEDEEKVDWLRKKFESPHVMDISKEDKLQILKRVSQSTLFENFFAKKYPSEKRFGSEGIEVLIPCLKDIIDQSAEVGVESFILGMAHRGRLNVIANVCHQPLEYIFCRFNDDLKVEDQGSGDVKYHLGVSRKHLNEKSSKEINVAIVANPSHLEAVDPVVKGKTKAEQYLLGDEDGSKVLSILIHGDASFSGQGVVYETIQLSDLPNYTVYGTVHVIANNQIGFTTDPMFSRSSRHCTDAAKTVNAPIFHVNADDPEAVSYVSTIASEYRNKFKKDIFIDLVGYRKHGHNEGDNPFFTQPLMYQNIASRPNVLDLYSKKLIDSGDINQETYNDIVTSYNLFLENEFKKSKKCEIIKNSDWIDSPWKGFFQKENSFKCKPTGVDIETLKKFQISCAQMPTSFNLYPGLKRVLNQRLEMLDHDKIDWAMGEIAAFSTLLSEGVHVRLSGEDVERGTFSHRHTLLHDNQVDKVKYIPLSNISPDQAKYVVCNSSLSEYGVLGFEHGYSIADPNTLTIWEAQFGDFANTAQCIIDLFVASGEDKWVRQSGLVMLLPHGFDGMGPEHSSARLERYLQLSKDDFDTLPNYLPDNFEVEQICNNNLIIANPTTPANLFHLLRRQLTFGFRKPLVVMSPKNLLRHEMARSSLADMGKGTSFRRILPDEGPASMKQSKVKRLILCSGKVYYELYKARADKGLEETVAITRIEQLAPFPYDLLSKEISKYSSADLIYVQEEPKNQGAYTYVLPRLLLSCNYGKKVIYSGRNASSCPATGSKSQHNTEQLKLVNDAFKF